MGKGEPLSLGIQGVERQFVGIVTGTFQLVQSRFE